MVARVRVLACEQSLPQLVETGRSHADEPAARDDEGQRPCVQIHGADKAEPSQQIRHGRQPDDEQARGPRQMVRAYYAQKEAGGEHERLHEEEPEQRLRFLKLHRQEREHAAPRSGGIHGKERRIAEQRGIRFESAQYGRRVHYDPPLDDSLRRVEYPLHQYSGGAGANAGESDSGFAHRELLNRLNVKCTYFM